MTHLYIYILILCDFQQRVASFLLILISEILSVNFVWMQVIQLQGDQRKNVSTFLVQVNYMLTAL